MNLRSIALAVVALTFPFALTPQAQSEEVAIYYILDASGSMWGRVDGGIKIQAAKDIMLSLLDELPPEVSSGLTAYGHRRKSDCSDIEELIPLGKIDKTLAMQKVNMLQPKGKTPIADSIVKVAESLKTREGLTTIVLVSDGIETCSKDPCQVTKQLRDSGVKFVMHVVGFDVRGETKAQLECVADAGGGRYFDAKNASELVSSLTAVKKSTIEKVQLPPTPIPTPEETPTAEPIKQSVNSQSSSVRIKAVGPGKVNLKIDNWVERPYHWKLVDPETGEEKGKFSSLDPQPISAGTYQLVWKQCEHGCIESVLGEVVTVESGKTVEVPLLTGVKFVTPTWVEPPYYWKLKDSSGEIVASFYQRLNPELVVPGEFELLYRQYQHASEEVSLGSVNIIPGKLNEILVDTAVNLVPAEWVIKDPYYWLLKETSGGKRQYKFYGKFEPQLVAAGEYEVIVQLRQHGTTPAKVGNLLVQEHQLNEFSLNSGAQLVSAKPESTPYSVKFVPLASDEQKVVELNNNLMAQPLAPGNYKVTLKDKQHGSSETVIVESFELPAGNLVEIEIP